MQKALHVQLQLQHRKSHIRHQNRENIQNGKTLDRNSNSIKQWSHVKGKSNIVKKCTIIVCVLGLQPIKNFY